MTTTQPPPGEVPAPKPRPVPKPGPPPNPPPNPPPKPGPPNLRRKTLKPGQASPEPFSVRPISTEPRPRAMRRDRLGSAALELLHGTSRPAELANLAARAAAGGTSAVEFEVTHLPPGAESPPGRAGTPDETLHFAAAGLRIEVATWPSASPDVAAHHDLSEAAVLGAKPVRLSGGGWTYRGSAVLNPGFVTDRSRSLDVLVSLGAPPWAPSHRDTLMLTHVLLELSRLAAETGSPILSLTSPAAPTGEAVGATRGDGSGERLRSPFAPCVRATIGLDADRPRARLTFERELAAFARELGLSLRLSDMRTGRIRGEWFAITPFQQARYRAARDALFGWAPDEPPAEALPVTALGPARLGATRTLCEWLSRSNVGCLGASLTVLQDIAFLNLLLPVAPPRVGQDGGSASLKKATDGLGRVASRCGMTTQQGTHKDGAQRVIDQRPVADHVLLAGTPTPCTFEKRHRSGLPSRFPLWVAWDMPPAGVDASEVLRSVTDALASYATVDVAFARSRRGDRGRLVGRAKLSVLPASRWPSDALTAMLGTMAARAQDTAVRRLALQLGVQAADVRLSVAWRERWLAHLAPSL